MVLQHNTKSSSLSPPLFSAPGPGYQSILTNYNWYKGYTLDKTKLGTKTLLLGNHKTNQKKGKTWGHVAAARKRSHQWRVSLTPNNTKIIGRIKCHCFLRPIRRDLPNSSNTTQNVTLELKVYYVVRYVWPWVWFLLAWHTECYFTTAGCSIRYFTNERET